MICTLSYKRLGDLFLGYIEPFIKYLDNCLVVFEDRITRLGTDFTRFWYISAARSLLYSTLNPRNGTREKQQAIELVARQYYRIRGSQDDLISVKDQVSESSIRGFRIFRTDMKSKAQFDCIALN